MFEFDVVVLMGFIHNIVFKHVMCLLNYDDDGINDKGHDHLRLEWY